MKINDFLVRLVTYRCSRSDRFTIGTTYRFGYNTFNIHLFYNLSTVFKKAYRNEEEIGTPL